MFERATDDIIALATAAAAAVVAVVAASFAIYAAFVPLVGTAWSAAIVAGIATAIVGVFALLANLRARAKERAALEAQAHMANTLPHNIAGLARDHPIAALIASLVGGALAARHPKLARDLVSLVAKVGGGR